MEARDLLDWGPFERENAQAQLLSPVEFICLDERKDG